ncbi:glycosyltransferase family 2 protein [Streptomyces sp. BPTC-684]|uniref:glycosyltransferase family 2 protein n=1 Tax=Streptomyces sp. BPTC-684 TaxID=3043734 RepID=UPI0024B208B2|nr:glycosyltransferase family 2 protein [Streptomyces sp. BPTC-684]WHM40069.1 glycosyltransferase family 2 protein [Streptomyces sp. BPTC-684]
MLGAVDGLFGDIVIVFNDETVDEARTARLSGHTSAPLSALHLPGPLGKAEAVRRGLDHLLRHSPAELFVQMDAHLKQAPEQVQRLLQRLQVQAGLGMVVANRYGSGASPLDVHRKTASSGFSALMRALTGYELTDTVCGTRAYRRELASVFARDSHCFGYGLELEQLFLAAAHGSSVEEEPVRSRPQAPTTAAEKIEDNLAVILAHTAARLSGEIRAALHHALAQIKLRKSFDLDARPFGLGAVYTCTFVGPAEDGEDSYAVAARHAHAAAG